MCITSPEAIPDIWDDQRDCAFFRITAHLFTTDFTYGAGMLLASNDVLDETAAPCQCSGETEPAGAATLVPVRVRRGGAA
jgi:hypothetical protein